MLSPILAFTADEAWEFIPGKTIESAHLARWPGVGFNASAEEQATWAVLLQVRDVALTELEKARQSKLIGKALEAKLVLSGKSDACAVASANQQILRELLNVSQLEVAKSDSSEIQVTVQKAAGQKCERCWHWETDVGSTPEHPTICARCVTAVKEHSLKS
jgi:isoleucyl-tRNA synthetase